MTDLIEKYAIIMAEGNNGGTWATHYTDSQKDLWRARAEKLIEDVLKKPTYDPNVDVEYTLRIAIDGKEEVQTWRETKPWSQTPFSKSDPK